MLSFILSACMLVGQTGNCSNGKCTVTNVSRAQPKHFVVQRQYFVRRRVAQHNCPCGQSCGCNPCRCQPVTKRQYVRSQPIQANCTNGQCYRN